MMFFLPLGREYSNLALHSAKGGHTRPQPHHSDCVPPRLPDRPAQRVTPEFVQGVPEALKQIDDDQLLTQKAYASSGLGAPVAPRVSALQAPLRNASTTAHTAVFNGTWPVTCRFLISRSAWYTGCAPAIAASWCLSSRSTAGDALIIDRALGLFTLDCTSAPVREGPRVTRAHGWGSQHFRPCQRPAPAVGTEHHKTPTSTPQFNPPRPHRGCNNGFTNPRSQNRARIYMTNEANCLSF